MRELRRLNAWINGAALRDVDSKIHVVNITENAPDQELTWADAPGRMGQRLLTRRRTNKRITIEFDIRELFDLSARRAVVDVVNTWARDGVLEVSYRPEQQIRVVLAKAAEFGGARDVTGSYTLDFDAAATPYWEDITPQRLEISGASGGGTIIIPGNAPAQPEITLTPTGGTLNTVTFGFAGKEIQFTGMSIPNGMPFVISHDERGLLTATAGAGRMLSLRTAASADDFEGGPGAVDAAYSASVACTGVFTVRGRWR